MVLRGSFKHEPITDFSLQDNRAKMKETFELIEEDLEKEFPLVVDREEVYCDEKIRSVNPANPRMILGVFQRSRTELLSPILKNLSSNHRSNDFSDDRCRQVLRIADNLRRYRFYFSGLMVKELGFNWRDANQEVIQSIEYFEYFARQALQLQISPYSDEDELIERSYSPIGTGILLPSLLNPFSGLAYMMALTMSAGNNVLVLPRDEAMLTCHRLIEIIHSAVPGMNACIAIATRPIEGLGEALGCADFLFQFGDEDEDRGSRYRRLATMPVTKLRYFSIGPCIQSIYIDADQNEIQDVLEDLIKCNIRLNGASIERYPHIFVHNDRYDEVAETVGQIMAEYTVGDPTNPDIQIGPLPNGQMLDRYRTFLFQQGDIAGEQVEEQGYFAEPRIIRKPQFDGMIHQLPAPVLLLHRVADLDAYAKICYECFPGLSVIACIGNSDLQDSLIRTTGYQQRIFFNKPIPTFSNLAHLQFEFPIGEANSNLPSDKKSQLLAFLRETTIVRARIGK